METLEDFSHLPYTENLINLVIVTEPLAKAEEIFRVMVPDGTIIYTRPEAESAATLEAQGFIHIKEFEVQLEEGDRIVTYTDGVNEAMNNDSEEFGEERFFTLVKTHARKSSKDFVDAVVKELEDHRGDAEQSDDITITTLSVRGGAKA